MLTKAQIMTLLFLVVTSYKSLVGSEKRTFFLQVFAGAEEYTLFNKYLHGFYQYIGQEIDQNIELTYYSTPRARLLFQNGHLDGFAVLTKHAKKIFPESIYLEQFPTALAKVKLISKDPIPPEFLKTGFKEERTIVYNRMCAICSKLAKSIGKSFEVNSETQALEMINLDRFKFGYGLVSQVFMMEAQVRDKSFSHLQSVVVATEFAYMALHPKHYALKKPIETAIDKMRKSGADFKIAKQAGILSINKEEAADALLLSKPHRSKEESR